MYTRKKMKLQYWLSPTADPETAIVKLSVSVDGKESQFSTKVTVIRKFWKSKTYTLEMEGKEADRKNKLFKAIIERAEQLDEMLRSKQMMYAAALVVSVLKYLQTKKSTAESGLLEDLVETDLLTVVNINEKKSCPGIVAVVLQLRKYKKGIAKNTLESYDSMLNKLKWYLGTIEDPGLLAKDFNEEHALAMSDYMLDEDLSPLYIKMCLMHYKDALKQAKKRGTIPTNPLSDFEYEASKEFNYVYLTNVELTQMMFIQNLTKPLKRALDAFRFMCYTSLHWTDYTSLTKDDLVFDGPNVWMEKRRDKTSIEYCQKMHPFAKQIISEYGTVEALPRFKYISFHQKVRRLAKLANIKKNVTPKTARKTFAYMCLNIWGYSLETTAKMMGLNKTDTIAYYAKVGRERVDREVKWDVV